MAEQYQVGMMVRFHLSAMTVDERKTFGKNLQKNSLQGKIVDVFGKNGRFVKINSKTLKKKVVVDSNAVFAVMNSDEFEKDEGNSTKALANKFNKARM